MDTKRLRQRVLDLAIHGKLVPQNPQDEPASELLKRITKEKEKLVKEGKIKKSKKKDNEDIDEVPFEVPQGWIWVKLSDIASFYGGKTPSMNNKDFWNNGTNLWVTSKDMKSSIIDDSLMKITDSALDDMKIFEAGTILMVTRSGILKRMLPLAILSVKATINQDLKAISLYKPSLPTYIYYFLRAQEKLILKVYHKDGTTVDSINFEKFVNIQIPLPPLAEQHRIVSEVEKYFSLIDILEESENDLQQSIQKAKSKILDLAIKGKLIEQNEEDEPAYILLERIKEEKNKNEKKGKIKDTEKINEVPFEVPQGWVWCRLGDIFHMQAGKAIKAEELNNEPDEFHQYACYGGNGIRGYINKYSNEGTYCIIGRQGALCGNIKMAEGQFYATEHAVVVYQFGLTNPYWAYHFLTQCNLNKYATATAQPGLSVAVIQDTLIPLPPLAEQHRIVAKIEELFTQLDNIAEALK